MVQNLGESQAINFFGLRFNIQRRFFVLAANPESWFELREENSGHFLRFALTSLASSSPESTSVISGALAITAVLI